jgi:DNA-binding IclR family transcriptional regulator
MSDENINRSTIQRVCSALNVFNEDDKVLSLTEISRRINLPKSTTHRLLNALEVQGLLNREPDGQGYRLGYQLIHWGMIAQRSLDLRNIALPILRSLSEATDETAVLSVRSGNAGIWIEQVETRQTIRLAMRVGRRLMLHAGASSKVLLAFLPDEQMKRIVSEIELEPIMPNTITDKGELLLELYAIRELGYAVSYEETDKDAMGIAAPVYDHHNHAIAGIGIVAPAVRIPPHKVPDAARLVIDASNELSKMLGASDFSYNVSHDSLR